MKEDLEQALSQAIHEQPLDDTPWLVLADWLDDQGDPRAELLRLQNTLRGELPDRHREQLESLGRNLVQSGVFPCAATLVNSISMRLALIRPGVFWMGSPFEEDGRYPDEVPRHLVRLTKPFYLGIHEVTQEQYLRVMLENPSHFSARGSGADRVRGYDTGNFPVDSVSWEDATTFCRRLSASPAEKAAGRSYRLPTEAEWEYACRGGLSSHEPFHFGSTLSSMQANFDGTRPYGNVKEGPNLKRTCPVGSYPPNGFGLFDMHGNLWEWCADWFDENYYATSPVEDPPGPDDGESRILRGGSFFYIGSSCRSSIRFGRRPESRSNLDGFRVAMTLEG